MAKRASKVETIVADPTKRFFVEMLTRDIDLTDAILDLLDNCIDGIHRSRQGPADGERPYENFWAKINLDSKHFSILDNCGGIPLDIARRSAFKMGRPIEAPDNTAGTVGMYGIGMKRAIFKMGRSATVESQTNGTGFVVEIPKAWFTSESWKLRLIRKADVFAHPGTKVSVTTLTDETAKIFARREADDFIGGLRSAIARHYSFIMEKGFAVSVCDKPVTRVPVTLLVSEKTADDGWMIEPYRYRATIDGVRVSLVVGFYREMLSPEDEDSEATTSRTADDSGWTIVCNDRVVVLNDRTRLTGWGEADVPNFHNQFIGIAGVVEFSSADPWKLPLTTTKRGLDTSSDLYLYIKNFMREGTKRFTDYTNRWKKHLKAEREVSKSAKPVPVRALLHSKDESGWKAVKGGHAASATEHRFEPRLPRPPEGPDPWTIIRFSKPQSHIKRVSELLFDDPSIEPKEVGEKCFDIQLARTKK